MVDDNIDAEQLDQLNNEIGALKIIKKHENIVQFVDSFWVQKDVQVDVWVVMDLIEGVTVDDIRKYGTGIVELKEVVAIFKGSLRAMKVLHGNNIAHCMSIMTI